MNNVQVMGALLLAAPEADDLAAMLTDELIEVQSLSRDDAESSVNAIRTEGRTAHALAQAAEFLAPGNPRREKLLALICTAVRHPDWCRASIVLVPGDAPPSSKQIPPQPRTNPWGDYVVTVGAAWVLSAAKRAFRPARA